MAWITDVSDLQTKVKKKDVRRNYVYVETICSDSYSDNDDMFVYLFELI